MKNELFIKDEDVNSLLQAVCFMSSVVLGETTFVDVFTDEEIKGFEVLCKFLFPLVQEIHKTRTEILTNLQEGITK